MAMGGIAKISTWLIRLLQLIFAVVLTGILSYMIHEFHKFGYKSPREVIVPEVFSILAMFVTFFSIMAICFLGHMLQLVAAFLDFVIFVGYLASASLLRHNYHRHSYRNPLRNALISIRVQDGYSSRHHRANGLVKALVALVVIQTILFLITTILSTFVARHERAAGGTYREKPSRFSRSSREPVVESGHHMHTTAV